MFKGKKAMLLWIALLLLGCVRQGPTAQTPQREPVSSGPAMVASSGIVEKIEFKDLATQADVIFVGNVTAMNSRWNDERTFIQTEVRIAIEQLVAGQLQGQECTLVVPGGEVGGVKQEVSTAPVFTVGERTLLLLVCGEGESLTVMGGFQGKLDIDNNTVLLLGTPLPAVLEQIKTLRAK